LEPVADRKEGRLRSEEEVRRQAISQLHKKRCFGVHLRAYIAVNILLVGIWAFTGGLFWPIFPILGWGVGLSAHGWAVFGQQKTFSEEQIQREAERLQKPA
jgi:fatty acid desaturase